MDPERTPQASRQAGRSSPGADERGRLRREITGRLAEGVAHDFNNMLTPVIGYIDIVAASLPAGTEEQGFLAQALGAAERATELSRRLLAFARRQPAAPSPQELGALLAGLAPLLEAVTPGSSRLAVAAATAPCWVLADVADVEQAIVVLALRARDAMPEGGELALATVRADGAGGAAAAAGIEAVVRDAHAEVATRARAMWPVSEAPPAGTGGASR